MRYTPPITRTPIYVLCFAVFLFYACSTDAINTEEEGSGPDDPQQEVPTNPTARSLAKSLYEEYYLAASTTDSDIPWTGDEPSCDAGSVTQETKDKIFRRLEYYRRAVGLLNTVAENTTKSQKAQLAALMMHANNQLDHAPPNSWKCYTEDGKEGAGNSLLTMINNAEAIDSYIRDFGADNGPVGHRRWLLWPRLQEIGIGNTDQANAIWVIGNAGTPPADAPEFISWPPEGYVPDRLVFPRWSFSIAGADFTGTRVSMTDKDGKNVSLQLEALSNSFGDRTIVWVPEGIDNSVSEDTFYTVTLEDVDIDGELKNYEYQVFLFDPNG